MDQSDGFIRFLEFAIDDFRLRYDYVDVERSDNDIIELEINQMKFYDTKRCARIFTIRKP